MFNVRVKYYPTGTEQVQIFSDLVSSKGVKREFDYEKYFSARDKHRIQTPFENEYSTDEKVLYAYGYDDEEERLQRSLESSLSRTRNKLFDIVRCNVWEWFVTLTFDPLKVNSFDYDEVCRNVSNWLKNMRKKCPDMMYIVVPEKHVSGRFHFHGLFSGIDNLEFSQSGIVDNKGRCVYNLDNYKLGFSTATKISDLAKVRSYLVKYITKELCEVSKGKKRYWASRNIPKPIVEEFYCLMTKEQILECIPVKDYTREVKTCFSDITYIDAPIYTTNTERFVTNE